MSRLSFLFLLPACGGLDPFGSGGLTGVEHVPAAIRPPGPAILINEVLPSNDSIAQDEAGEFDDWIELYSVEPHPVLLDGFRLVIDDDVWTFPVGSSISPGEHRLVWVDGQPEQGPWHATGHLSKDGSSVHLVGPDGAVSDEVDVPPVPAADVVVGRFPSGSEWIAGSIAATPGAENPDAPGGSLDPSDAWFPTDRVLRVDLTLAQDQYDALAADSNAIVQGGVAFDGISLAPVAISIKGGWGSSRSLYGKSGFKVNFDQYVPGARIRGLEKLTLNNMVQDWSCVHEMLGYDVLRRAGVPAPRTSYAEVYLNGQYRGLYLNVESPDDQFLQRWYDDPNGNLYEGAYGQDITWGGYTALHLDEQGSEDVTDYSDLAALDALLQSAPSEYAVPQLEALVDVDTTLAAMAGETVLGHWDGYFYAANNYRLYHDPSGGGFTLIPWGIDQTWGWSGDLYSAAGDLSWWMLQIPSIQARYDAALLDVAEAMRAVDAPTAAWTYGALIAGSLEADPYKEFGGMDSNTAAIQSTVDWAVGRPDAVEAVARY